MKNFILFFSILFLSSCTFLGYEIKKVDTQNVSLQPNILSESSELSEVSYSDSFTDNSVNTVFDISNLGDTKEDVFIKKFLSLVPKYSLTTYGYTYLNKYLYSYYEMHGFDTEKGLKLFLQKYYASLTTTQDVKGFFSFFSELGLDVNLDIDIEAWIEEDGVTPANIDVSTIVEYYYAQEDPNFVWDPSELADGTYTYLQGVLEFLTFCEEYNVDPESIFRGYEKNHLKEEYFGDYKTHQTGGVNENTLISKYTKRQVIHLSDGDFTEPSFIEPFKAIYKDQKLNCGDVITNNYNTVFSLGDTL